MKQFAIKQTHTHTHTHTHTIRCSSPQVIWLYILFKDRLLNFTFITNILFFGRKWQSV